MQSAYHLKAEHPKQRATCLSKIFFMWLFGLTRKSIKVGLDLIDLPKSVQQDDSKNLGDCLEKMWKEEVEKSKKKNKKPKLIKVLFKMFFFDSFLYGLLFFLQVVVFRVLQPVILSSLISLFMKPKDNDIIVNMSILSACLVIDAFIMVILSHHATFGEALVGMRIRVAVSSLIYRKILKLTETSLRQTTPGQIVNLLSNDVSRFDYVTLAIQFLWIFPFPIMGCMYFLWNSFGVSSLVGLLGIIILTIPVQGVIARFMSKFRLMVADRADNRIKLMNEIVSGMQVIKMYAWEKPFERVVAEFRRREVSALAKCSYMKGFYLSSIVFIERFTLFLTITCFALLGNPITPNNVFAAAQFFNILQLVMAIYFQMGISYGAETMVTIRRLEEFLALNEMQDSTIEQITYKKGIYLEKVTACWEPENLTLHDLNVCIPDKTHCAVIGPVGAGKSSFLQLLLGELKHTCGKIQIGGQISYASQEPWLFSASVRKNILFGEQFDEKRYQKVVTVCELEKDFQQFPLGDKTIIGERGVSLSGGQRARINLARCIYRKANIYLLDDPLSAVDTHVGKALFNNCIKGFLRDKTCILVTHQLHFLQQMPLIVVLNEGEINVKGSFQDVSSSEMGFLKFLTSDEQENEESKNKLEQSLTDKENTYANYEDDRTDFLNEDQEKFQNSSPFKNYIKYSGNWCLIFGLVLCFILAQVFCSATDFFVAFWTNQEVIRHNETAIQVVEFNQSFTNSTYKNKFYYYKHQNDTFDEIYDKFFFNNSIQYLIKENIIYIIYTVLITISILVTISRSMYFFKMAMNASKNLHNAMFNSLLEAPMRFFDRNQSGKILNRFSKDMGEADDFVPRVSIEASQILLVMTGILINVVITNYYIVVPVILIAIIFMKFSIWFLKVSKNIKHIEGKAKSPVFSHITATLNGISTIRASHLEQTLIKQFDDHQNVHSSAWYLTISMKQYFGLCLDLISVVFLAILSASFILLEYYSSVNGSLMGLALSQSLILTGMLQYGMQQVSDVVSSSTSIERILHYTQLEKEGPFETDPTRRPYKSWPNKGQIQFKNVFLKYTVDDPPVLKNLNILIESKQKIGIVGRTGAGKSSLISALFRLAILEGEIFIDGLSTKNIGLNDLRKKISIIPQEPVLFSASVRYNLDPFEEYSDESIWSALNEVELKNVISSLDMYITEGGNNFSVGQRQLICLARAILRNNKILIMDEATANVDPKTDFLIQSAIRRKFANCTVLTIAHRLNTIMDSDKVLVMRFGEMVEFDHPHILLQNPESAFTQMVLETSPKMTAVLREAAYDAYMKTQG